MSSDTIKNMGHSVNVRLKNLAQEQNVGFDYLLLRYAYERFLYRLGHSPYAERFILKGASAFSVWFGPMLRVTRDTDLLCHGDSDPEHLVQCFREICETSVPDDGIVFDISSITASEIKKDAQYQGTRIAFYARIQNARVPMQFDIAFGDSVYPEAELQEYPRLLNTFPAPSILVYSRYTVIAEKFEAIISLGMLNSRLKDYYDIWLLSERFDFDYLLLGQAISKTFRNRGTIIPVELPIGLSGEFYEDPLKQSQWRAFLERVSPEQKPKSLRDAVNGISALLRAFILSKNDHLTKWIAGKGWQ